MTKVEYVKPVYFLTKSSARSDFSSCIRRVKTEKRFDDRLSAYQTMRGICPQAASNLLNNVFLFSKIPQLREIAIYHLGDGMATSKLVKFLLEDRSGTVRFMAAHVLRRRKSEDAVTAFIQTIQQEKTSDPYTLRMEALMGLADIANLEAIKFMGMLLEDRHAAMVHLAASCLGEIANEQSSVGAIDFIFNALDSENYTTQDAAGGVVARVLKGTLAVQRAERLLNDSRSWVVACAIKCIGNNEGADLSALYPLLNHDDAEIRELAREEIAKKLPFIHDNPVNKPILQN